MMSNNGNNHENGQGRGRVSTKYNCGDNGKEQNKNCKNELKGWLPKRIIVVRHGESSGNAALEAYGTTPNHKMELTPKGIVQAKQCGELIKNKLSSNNSKSWKVLFYVSPATRTLQTLREMARSFPKNRVLGVKEEHMLREQHFGNFNDTAAISKIKDERTTYGRFFYRVPGGESGAEVYDRISSFVDNLRRDIDEKRFCNDPPSEELNLVLVTHGLTSRMFMMKWFKWTIEEFEKLNRMKPGEFQIMELGKGGGDYSLAIHHDDNKLSEWGLSPDMIEDQKRRAYSSDSVTNHHQYYWDTHRFLHQFPDSHSHDDNLAQI